MEDGTADIRLWLREGAEAVLAGKRADACALLLRVVEADERNAEAWLWLSGAVDDPADVLVALHNCRDLKPGTEIADRAQAGLDWMAQHGHTTPGAG